MTKRLSQLIIIAIVPLLVGAGCSLSSQRAADGGVWFSPDKGETWEQRVFVRQEKKKTISIDSLNVSILKSHLRDSRIIYAGTNKGIYFTEDAAMTWAQVYSEGQVADLSLDPTVRGIVYVAVDRRILKTTDNGRTWEQRYLEPRAKASMTRVLVNPINNAVVYAGNSAGDLLRSDDFGKSWRVLENFRSSIAKIIVNEKDDSIIYAATLRRGINASFDRGASWQNLLEFYEDFDRSHRFHQLLLDRTGQSSLLYASEFGLLKSDDGGFTWFEIPTISPPRSVTFRALEQNPSSPSEIYYATDDALVRSFDGGQTWVALSLPTRRSAAAILVDFFDSSKVYLGAAKAQK